MKKTENKKEENLKKNSEKPDDKVIKVKPEKKKILGYSAQFPGRGRYYYYALYAQILEIKQELIFF